MTDSDLSPKENVEEAEEQTGGKAGEYANQTTVYSFLILISGIGFIIGAIIAGILAGGVTCLFEIMNIFTSNISAGAGGETDLMESAQDQYMMCLQTSMFNPIVLLFSFIGGLITGYPSYKVAKMVASGQHLRTII